MDHVVELGPAAGGPPLPEEAPFLKQRVRVLQRRLAQEGAKGALFFYSRDVLYYAGSGRPSVLLVTPESTLLWVRRGMALAQEESTADHIFPGGGIDEVCAWIAGNLGGEGLLATELDLVPAKLFLRLKDWLPGYRWTDASPWVLSQRLVKDDRERAILRRGAAMVDRALAQVPSILHPGMTELDLAAILEGELRRAGHEVINRNRRFDAPVGFGFIASGENLARFHGFAHVLSGAGPSKAFAQSASHRRIASGEVVMVDLTGLHLGYVVDVARPYVVGKASPRQKDVFASLAAIREGVLQELRPGRAMRDVYDRAVRIARQTGFEPYFMGCGEKGDFVAHGLGLELDEPPVVGARSNGTIEEHMALAIELNHVIPGWGGMKLEEAVLVRTGAPEVLSRTAPALFEVV